MVATTKTFQCIVVAPSGKLVDRPVFSVIIPAHDGQRGIMSLHSPMFCELGLGILEFEASDEATGLVDKERMLVDGGFAVICENQIKIVSYDVVYPPKVDEEILEDTLNLLRKDAANEKQPSEDRQKANKKLALLEKLVPSTQ